MKNFFFLITCLLFLTNCQQANIIESGQIKNNLNTENNPLKIAYCPTMASKIKQLQAQNNNLQTILLGSSNQALEQLKNNQIDLALIWRKAEKWEISAQINEKRLTEKDYTLTSNFKNFILANELPHLKVNSCLEKTIVEKNFSELNVNFKECSEINNQENWLIEWNDFNDEMKLLIPVYPNNKKVEKYRSPFLYGKKEVIEKIKL